MSTSSAAEVLVRTRELVPGPAASIYDRRKFQELLITLPRYSAYENKAFFGLLVAKYFGEFEDLQDSAIDALLDLCEDEDEKVRIIGIKGLGPTGRSDPRWVKGNTGVLLQLLACQPRELKYVKESLQTLLSVSPIDVFGVMIDDCRGSEEETGASRRNILEYLRTDAAETRKTILETGNNLTAEDIFRKGLFDVLQNSVSEEESELILELLEPLSTISGKNALTKTKNRYMKALINSLPPNSTTQKTQHLTDIFKRYVGKIMPIDPRYIILFLAQHGAAVIELGLESKDPSAEWLLDGLKDWSRGVVAQWEKPRDEKDLEENTLAPAFVNTTLPPFLDGFKALYRSGKVAGAASTTEVILFTIYQITTIHDRRSELVRRSIAHDLSDVAEEGIKILRRLSKGSTESRRWENIIDMAEILADPRSKIIKIVPSWELSSSKVPPTGPSKSFNDVSKTSAAPSAPRGPRSTQPHLQTQTTPSGPRNGSSAGPSSHHPRNVPTGPASNTSRYSSSAGSMSSSHLYPTPQPRSYDRRPRSPGRRPRSPETRTRSPERRPQSPNITNLRPSVNKKSRSPGNEYRSSKTRSPSTDRRRPSSPDPSLKTKPLTLPPSQPNHRTITPVQPSVSSVLPVELVPLTQSSQSTAENSQKPTLTIRSAAASVVETSSPKIPFTPTPVPRVTSPPPRPALTPIPTLSIRQSAPAYTSPSSIITDPPSKRSSLADRLGVSTSVPSSTNKRPRNADELQPVKAPDQVSSVTSEDRPLLLSRLGSRDVDPPQAKKAKVDKDKQNIDARSKESTRTDGSRLSLLDRINGKPSSSPAPPSESSIIKDDQLSVPPSTSNKPFSILNRSFTASSSTNNPPTQPKQGLSFLSRSSQAPPPSALKTLSILNRAAFTSSSGLGTESSISPKDEEVIVRKGRGFRAKTPDGLDILTSESSTSEDGPGSSLASRLTVGPGIRGRGRGVPAFGFGSRGLVRPHMNGQH
ncbi:uncharacterized protein IL334_005667 [Kwoniella shivajii]|uniref:Uncharacterized protein n=1 Tax=Kwoniella shivajii TaxID=564305 RepID=A0ABZ1D518_9TREE|nr:hypothetical protein IL334_005667 [Kwoniella shivajii]